MAVNRYNNPFVYQYQSQYVPTELPFDALQRGLLAKQGQADRNRATLAKYAMDPSQAAGIEYLTIDNSGKRVRLGEKSKNMQRINEFNSSIEPIVNGFSQDMATPEIVQLIAEKGKEYRQLSSEMELYKQRETNAAAEEKQLTEAKGLNDPLNMHRMSGYLQGVENYIKSASNPTSYTGTGKVSFGDEKDYHKMLLESIAHMETQTTAWAQRGSAADPYIKHGTMEYRAKDAIEGAALLVMQNNGTLDAVQKEAEFKDKYQGAFKTAEEKSKWMENTVKGLADEMVAIYQKKSVTTGLSGDSYAEKKAEEVDAKLAVPTTQSEEYSTVNAEEAWAKRLFAANPDAYNTIENHLRPQIEALADQTAKIKAHKDYANRPDLQRAAEQLENQTKRLSDQFNTAKTVHENLEKERAIYTEGKMDIAYDMYNIMQSNNLSYVDKLRKIDELPIDSEFKREFITVYITAKGQEKLSQVAIGEKMYGTKSNMPGPEELVNKAFATRIANQKQEKETTTYASLPITKADKQVTQSVKALLSSIGGAGEVTLTIGDVELTASQQDLNPNAAEQGGFRFNLQSNNESISGNFLSQKGYYNMVSKYLNKKYGDNVTITSADDVKKLSGALADRWAEAANAVTGSINNGTARLRMNQTNAQTYFRTYAATRLEELGQKSNLNEVEKDVRTSLISYLNQTSVNSDATTTERAINSLKPGEVSYFHFQKQLNELARYATKASKDKDGRVVLQVVDQYNDFKPLTNPDGVPYYYQFNGSFETFEADLENFLEKTQHPLVKKRNDYYKTIQK